MGPDFNFVLMQCSAYIMVMALNNLKKEGWPVLHRLCKDLEQIPIFIVVNQNVQSLKNVQVLNYFHFGVLQILSQLFIVTFWHYQELRPALS